MTEAKRGRPKKKYSTVLPKHNRHEVKEMERLIGVALREGFVIGKPPKVPSYADLVKTLGLAE